MITKLSLDYFEECSSFTDLKTRTSGTVHLSKEKFKEKYRQFFIDEPNKHCYGYFEDGKLTSFMCVAFLENKVRGKFWIIAGYYTNKFRNFFTWNNPEAGLLLKYIIELAESLEYFEWYYSVSKRIMNVFEKQWQKNMYVQVGRYERVILDIIQPYTQPESELYWRLIGEELKPDEIVIKKRILKHEYRNK